MDRLSNRPESFIRASDHAMSPCGDESGATFGAIEDDGGAGIASGRAGGAARCAAITPCRDHETTMPRYQTWHGICE
jgi:hypothetical protein